MNVYTHAVITQTVKKKLFKQSIFCPLMSHCLPYHHLSFGWLCSCGVIGGRITSRQFLNSSLRGIQQNLFYLLQLPGDFFSSQLRAPLVS